MNFFHSICTYQFLQQFGQIQWFLTDFHPMPANTNSVKISICRFFEKIRPEPVVFVVLNPFFDRCFNVGPVLGADADGEAWSKSSLDQGNLELDLQWRHGVQVFAGN